jgi:hypothetical protein
VGNNILAESTQIADNSGGGSSDDGGAPWLPRWLSFLAGIPEMLRRRRVIVNIQAYVDETGSDGKSPLFLFSALIAQAETWAQIVEEWDAHLKCEPSIQYFKMDEAAGLDAQFYGFSDTERDEKVKGFCRLLNAPDVTELHSGWRLEDFKGHWSPRLGRPASEPYFFPFQMTIFSVAYEALSRKQTEPFEIFFDENNIFGPRAKAWYPVIRELAPSEIRAILPVEPLFRSEQNVLPLQAADLTAWITRHATCKTLGGFSWLKERLALMNKSPLSRILDKEWIAKMLAHKPSEAEMQGRKRALEVYRDIFEHNWPPTTKVEKKRHRGYIKNR